MADGHGGYRKPSKPAAVSGPGRFSKRTDGKPGTQPVRPMTGGPYGEGQEMSELQSSAPMSDTSGMPPSSGGGFSLPQVTPLGAPTERPDEPVTAGAPVGEGPGPEALGLGDPNPELQILKKYLPLLEPVVDRAEVPPSVRQLYTFIRDS